MGTLYTLITGFSITNNKFMDVILFLIFDSIAFTVAWKIGGLGKSYSSRSLLHWISRIGIYVVLVILIQKFF